MAELMKGKVWQEHKHKLVYPVMAEVKYDEIRCHVIVHSDRVDFLSYAGKPLANMQAFSTRFKLLTSTTGFTEFDCGFEVNSNFNDSYRWVRSTKGLPANFQANAVYRFILFDLPEVQDMPYSTRRELIKQVAGFALDVPKLYPCFDEAQVMLAYHQAREDGFEGLMVKSCEHLYQRGKRIDGWLKLKPNESADGIIQCINQAHASKDFADGTLKGDPLGRAGSVSLVLPDESTVQPHGIPHALGKEMWEHPERFIGECVEFNYMERDRQGGYRHPTFFRIREAV